MHNFQKTGKRLKVKLEKPAGVLFSLLQLERNLNELKLTVDDYHGQLQRSKVKGGRPAGNNLLDR